MLKWWQVQGEKICKKVSSDAFDPDWSGLRRKARKQVKECWASVLRDRACSVAGFTGATNKDDKFTKEQRATVKQRSDQKRYIWDELAELEALFVGDGHVDKNWHAQLK